MTADSLPSNLQSMELGQLKSVLAAHGITDVGESKAEILSYLEDGLYKEKEAAPLRLTGSSAGASGGGARKEKSKQSKSKSKAKASAAWGSDSDGSNSDSAGLLQHSRMVHMHLPGCAREDISGDVCSVPI